MCPPPTGRSPRENGPLTGKIQIPPGVSWLSASSMSGERYHDLHPVLPGLPLAGVVPDRRRDAAAGGRGRPPPRRRGVPRPTPRRTGLQIVGVINTHFHADFLAGHLELAAATGAWIGYGSGAERRLPDRASSPTASASRSATSSLEIMETPGHTPESISVLVFEHADDEVPYGVLTGDALFIGDVGRPDLLASIGLTADELGRMLYALGPAKLMTLPDAVRVFPAHGAGSACGKNLSTERWSTIGEQRTGQLRLSADERGRLPRSGHRGAAGRPGLLRLRRRAQPQARTRVRRRRRHAPAAGPAPRCSDCRHAGAVRGRRPRPAGVRRRAPGAAPSTSRPTAGSPRPRAWSCAPTSRSS